ncbi:hypothetical protein SALBM135S_00875 [Streptomyces alboniger]
MTFKFEQPPAKLTWYYLGPLLDADAGPLKYNKARYKVSGVSNNAVACVWCDLLAPEEDGLVLTDLGRRMLDEWKSSPEGQKFFSEGDEALHGENGGQDAKSAPPPQTPAGPAQLDLFGGAA